jgi:hypothetical protein
MTSFYKTKKINFKIELLDILQQNGLQIRYVSGLHDFPKAGCPNA